MKKWIVVLLVFVGFGGFSQVRYKPAASGDLERIGRLLVQDRLASYLAGGYVSVGFMDLGPMERIVSYNPIEGVRLRAGGRTNAKFSKRFGLDFLLAYGTGDKRLKYGISAAVSFRKKPQSVYGFPANVLRISYMDDSYMPNLAGYDAVYYSFSPWNSYYLSYSRKLSLVYLKEFRIGLGFSPFVGIHNIYSDMYYDGKECYETLSKDYNYLNAGVEVFFRPQRRKKGYSSLNSRFNSLATEVSAKYIHNFLMQEWENSYSVASFLASERIFVGRNAAVDVRLHGGKIFGSTVRSLYFSPLQSYGYIANPYGMNLLDFSSSFYRKEYLQCFLQINFGGLLMDNISFLKPFRMNEFIYGKALYGERKPYYEVGVGLDNIFSAFGVEVIRSFNLEDGLENGFWGVRIRVRQ